MTNKIINVLRNDILGGGLPNTSMSYFSATQTHNVNAGSTELYLINSTLSTSSGSVKPSDWDNSNNGSAGFRGSIFRGTNADDSSGFRHERSTKYNRPWGALLGGTSTPPDSRNKAWLHGVKGLEMNWKLDGHWGWFTIEHLGIVYGNSRLHGTRLYYMPLIYDSNLYPGATMNYSGTNSYDVY